MLAQRAAICIAHGQGDTRNEWKPLPWVRARCKIGRAKSAADKRSVIETEIDEVSVSVANTANQYDSLDRREICTDTRAAQEFAELTLIRPGLGNGRPLRAIDTCQEPYHFFVGKYDPAASSVVCRRGCAVKLTRVFVVSRIPKLRG